MKKLLASAILAGLVAPQAAIAAEEVNVYSYRQPFLVEPMFKEFTDETGIKVNVKFAKKGLAEKLQQEGKYSPADVILTTDISRLVELSDKQLVQPVDSKIIDENVPAQYRDNEDEWFALTLRARNVYSSVIASATCRQTLITWIWLNLSGKARSVRAQASTRTTFLWCLR
ncbi:ferric iron ABC transporter iron-binding protein [Photobacterium aphoticum]|uniref:Ferric iron ABC transporter iron-binding protein n=1 Tax=Photobacterium aphoticum TaxID=754436 RepID=A0A090RG58_9GAMM|nr:ferric iron ABC transporter iron-binding protein [Photobacterium aphoticum]